MLPSTVRSSSVTVSEPITVPLLEFSGIVRDDKVIETGASLTSVNRKESENK